MTDKLKVRICRGTVLIGLSVHPIKSRIFKAGNFFTDNLCGIATCHYCNHNRVCLIVTFAREALKAYENLSLWVPVLAER